MGLVSLNRLLTLVFVLSLRASASLRENLLFFFSSLSHAVTDYAVIQNIKVVPRFDWSEGRV